jgi:hypothetical protein
VPAEPAGVLYRPTTLGEPSCPAFKRPQAAAVLWEGGTLEEIAFGFVDRGDGDRRLVGVDPDQDLHARVPPFRSDLSAIDAREGHSDFGLLLPYLL